MRRPAKPAGYSLKDIDLDVYACVEIDHKGTPLFWTADSSKDTIARFILDEYEDGGNRIDGVVRFNLADGTIYDASEEIAECILSYEAVKINAWNFLEQEYERRPACDDFLRKHLSELEAA